MNPSATCGHGIFQRHDSRQGLGSDYWITLESLSHTGSNQLKYLQQFTTGSGRMLPTPLLVNPAEHGVSTGPRTLYMCGFVPIPNRPVGPVNGRPRLTHNRTGEPMIPQKKNRSSRFAWDTRHQPALLRNEMNGSFALCLSQKTSGSGGIRTRVLQVMSLARFHFSTLLNGNIASHDEASSD